MRHICPHTLDPALKLTSPLVPTRRLEGHWNHRPLCPLVVWTRLCADEAKDQGHQDGQGELIPPLARRTTSALTQKFALVVGVISLLQYQFGHYP